MPAGAFVLLHVDVFGVAPQSDDQNYTVFIFDAACGFEPEPCAF